MTTKIIFSDGRTLVLSADNGEFFNQLKEVRSDKGINDLMQRFEGTFNLCDESAAAQAQTTIDLRKKKLSSVKRMMKAFGVKR